MIALPLMDKIDFVRITDAAAAYHLQRIVQNALPPMFHNYIKDRSEFDYISLVQQNSLYGVYADNHLVSMVFLTIHESRSFQTDFNQTRQFSDAVDTVYDFGIIGGLMVHPDWQGHGIGHALVRYVQSLVTNDGLDCVFAETIAGNQASIRCFTDNNFTVIGHEFYPPLNTNLCLLAYVPVAMTEEKLAVA